MELRPYQVDAVDRLRKLLSEMPAGERRAILQASCGAGKTIMAAHIIHGLVAKQKRCLFLAPSRELVTQCSDKLRRLDVPHGIIMSGRGYDLEHPVQVATKDTLLSRVINIPKKIREWQARLDSGTLSMQDSARAHKNIERWREMALELPEFHLIVPDEAHLSTAPTWKMLIRMFPNAVVVGLTATPAKGNGQTLGGDFNGMIQAVKTSQLIADGFLVHTRVFGPYQPDLAGMRVNPETGEYVREELEKRMNKPKLVGDIVDHWKRLAEGKKTIVFASGVSHSMAILEQFQAAGVKCEHLDGTTEDDVRDGMLCRFQRGETLVLTNCNVLTAGFDCPDAEVCILAKPTQSFVQFMQMIGRVMRPAEGKKEAILIDHAGCVHFFKHMPNWDIDWQLKPGETIQDKVKPDAPSILHCPKCHALYSGSVCPACGHSTKPEAAQPKNINQENGILIEIDDPLATNGTQNESAVRKWKACLGWAANTGRTAGAAAGRFKREMNGKGPWEFQDMPNMPARGEQLWSLPVAELFPQYVAKNRKKVQA